MIQKRNKKCGLPVPVPKSLRLCVCAGDGVEGTGSRLMPDFSDITHNYMLALPPRPWHHFFWAAAIYGPSRSNQKTPSVLLFPRSADLSLTLRLLLWGWKSHLQEKVIRRTGGRPKCQLSDGSSHRRSQGNVGLLWGSSGKLWVCIWLRLRWPFYLSLPQLLDALAVMLPSVFSSVPVNESETDGCSTGASEMHLLLTWTHLYLPAVSIHTLYQCL